MSSDTRRCTAIRDYVAKADDELTFREGDIVFVPKRIPGDRWQGVFNGKVGWFPKIYVDDKTVEVKAGKTTRVRAIRAYEGQSEEELSFPLDAVMFVVARESEKYWKGVYNGKPGLILATEVEDAEKKEVEAKWEGAKCKAIKSHVTTEAGKLPFKAGDTVFVPKPDPALDTWKGVSNNQVGDFPRACVVDTKEMSEEQIKKLVEAATSDEGEKKAAEELGRIQEEQRQKLLADASISDASAADEEKSAAKPAPTPASEPTSAPAEPTPAEVKAPAVVLPEEPKEPEAPKAPEPAKEPEAAPAAATGDDAPAVDESALSPKEKKALEKERKKKEKEDAKRAKEEEKARKKLEKEEAKKNKKK